MTVCYCGSGKEYHHCCQPIHTNAQQAQTPEQLMRARYSAHVLGLTDFVVNTYHPSCQADKQRDEIAASINSQWHQLEVLRSWFGSNENEGFVHFKAFYQTEQTLLCLEEQSRFVHENNQWFYIDGVFPQRTKIGRNDPCLCGSGQKSKKCCG
jgi:SEC-C motif-containing protein